MKIIRYILLTLLVILVSGCATVEQYIIVDENAEPDKQYEISKQAQGTSATLQDKKYLDNNLEGITPEKETLPQVRPLFNRSSDWDIAMENDQYTVTLTGGKGIFTVKHISDTGDDGQKWLSEKLAELDSMGFFFGSRINIKDLHISGDNRDSKMMMGPEFEDFFDPDVTTLIGFLGNRDCIWEVSGYVSDPRDSIHFVNLIGQASLISWEK